MRDAAHNVGLLNGVDTSAVKRLFLIGSAVPFKHR